MRQHPSRSMSEVGRRNGNFFCSSAHSIPECIVYTWDYRTSQSVWNGLRVQPILSDEVQTFKALILVHKVLQEGHQVVSVWLRPLCFHLDPSLTSYTRKGLEGGSSSDWLV